MVMLAFKPTTRRGTNSTTQTSTVQPLPSVIHSPHTHTRASHVIVTTTDISPDIPTTWYTKYHHYYHLLSILLYKRLGLIMSIISTLMYVTPILTSIIVMSMTWGDACDRPLNGYLIGVLIKTLLSLASFLLYIRTSRHSVMIPTQQHTLFMLRWCVTLSSIIWMGIGTYWIFTSNTCVTTSSLLYHTAQAMLLYFYIGHTITLCLTVIIYGAFPTCMSMLSKFQHSQGVLRSVPVKVFEPNEMPPSSAHCQLCLHSYQPTQQLRQFSSCHHSFHRICSEQWLSLCISCPICSVAISYPQQKKYESSEQQPHHTVVIPSDGVSMVPRSTHSVSRGPTSEPSHRATTQIMSSAQDETTPTRTTPHNHPTSTSSSSALVSPDEVEMFSNPVMNALQHSQDTLQQQRHVTSQSQPSHHNKSQSQQSSTTNTQAPAARPPPQPRGSQTHRPSLIRSMTNPGTGWEFKLPRAMSDPIDRPPVDADDDMPPYEYDSDEESRDIVRFRRLRSFAKNRPAFVRPLPHPRSATEPNTPRGFALPAVPASPNGSDAGDLDALDIPGHAPGNMVMTRHALISFGMEIPSMRTDNHIRPTTTPSSPRHHTLQIMTELDDDDFVETPDPVLNTTPANILKQQMEGYRVRRTLSIEGLAEAKASEEKIKQLKQQKQRYDEMNALRAFAQTLKHLEIPTNKHHKTQSSQYLDPRTLPQPPMPPEAQHHQQQQQQQQYQQQYQHQPQQQSQQQYLHPPQQQQQQHQQRPQQTQSRAQPKSAQKPLPDPRVQPQRQHAQTVTQYEQPPRQHTSTQNRSSHVMPFQDIPTRPHSNTWDQSSYQPQQAY